MIPDKGGTTVPSMLRKVNRKPISYGLVRVASADSTSRIASIFLRSILNALERFREVEYRFAALVVNILVVIRIRLGMTRPNPRRMTVRSLFCMAMAAIAPQTIIRMLPPRSPVRVAETAAFVSLA